MDRVLFAQKALSQLAPDVSEDPGPYDAWVKRRETERVAQTARLSSGWSLHLVLLVEGEVTPAVIETLRSLDRQTEGSWKLTVVIDTDQLTAFTSLLSVSGLRRSTARVQIIKVDRPTSVIDRFAAAVETTSEAGVSLIYPGDVWAPDAVERLASALPPGGMVYADEDHLSEDGRYDDPRLKPAYSPELLLRLAYIGRPLALSAELVRALPPAGSARWDHFEHDLSLRASEGASSVVHVPEVLCHRTQPIASTDVGDVDHVVAALARRGDSATVNPGRSDTYRITRPVPQDCLSSIIIPFRDAPQLLRTCIDSVDATTSSSLVEYLLVDNGSVEAETMTLIEELSDRPDVHVHYDARPFNWAQLNNVAAAQANGDVLVFLNNDIEARTNGWLDALCAHALRPDVGAVGARLLYPDSRVQHCGVVLGLGGAAGHILVGLASDSPGYLKMAMVTRECAAITGACLATSRSTFTALGGFDDSLGIDLNDIDYCLRAQRAGMRIVFESDAELIHYESPSRGTAGDVRDIVRFIRRWQDSIIEGDPYLSSSLTRMDGSCRLRVANEDAWWQQWFANLTLIS